MNDSETPAANTSKVKTKFSMERLAIVIVVAVVVSLISCVFLPSHVQGSGMIPVLAACFATSIIFQARDRRQRGEISDAELKRQTILIVVGTPVYSAVLLVPFFLWPENSFKMFMLWAAALLVIVLSIQGVVALIKKRKRARQSEPDEVV